MTLSAAAAAATAAASSAAAAAEAAALKDLAAVTEPELADAIGSVLEVVGSYRRSRKLLCDLYGDAAALYYASGKYAAASSEGDEANRAAMEKLLIEAAAAKDPTFPGML